MKSAHLYFDKPAPGLGRHDAAAYCGTCVRLLDQWRADGDGPEYFRIGTAIRYWPCPLDRYLDGRPKLKLKAEAFRKVCPYTFDAHFDLVPAHDDVLLPWQLADRLGVSKRILNYWRDWGCGPAYVLDRRHVTYTGAAVRKYLAYDEQQLGLNI